MLLVDDPGFDSDAGVYFPTLTGVAGWASNEDKDCIEDVNLYVVNNMFQSSLDQIAGLDKLGVGYVIGVVTDADKNPLAGATVEAPSHPGAVVVYPSADFSDLTGSQTSATGVFVLPEQTSLRSIIGVKDGYTWDPQAFKVATIPGVAHFLLLVAD